MEFLIVAIFVGALVYVIMNNGQKSEKERSTKNQKKLDELENSADLEELTYRDRKEFVGTITSIITNLVNESKSEYSNVNLNSFSVNASTNENYRMIFGYKTRVLTYDFRYAVVEDEKATNKYNNKRGIIIVNPNHIEVNEEKHRKKYDMIKSHQIFRDILNSLEDDEFLEEISLPADLF